MDIPDEEEKAGLPGWMATFADLMSLLMTFFVLLLSFSEMDAQKYRLIAGSMKNAFGVQSVVEANETPAGPEDTEGAEASNPTDDARERIEALMAATEAVAEELQQQLSTEISEGFVEVDAGFQSITIRIKERGSFSSGMADLQADFAPVMAAIAEFLQDVEGRISVEGHTDNIDINTERFPSNWALSSARALSVGHALLQDGVISGDRLEIVGHADTQPYMPNDTAEGRAANRRVEIVVKQEITEEISADLDALKESNPELISSINATLDTG